MSKSIFITPKNYRPLFSLKETETAIKTLKDHFEKELADALHLNRVSAPLFVFSDTGLNDNLNGTEAPVSFQAALAPEKTLEIIHSLAKWKRMALHRYGFQPGEGLYTDMNAIRKDEVLSNLHSIYVDQWDWEIILPEGQRTKYFLKQTVRKIFSVFKKTEAFICSKYPQLEKIGLPEDIHFVTTQELEDTYPDLTPKERENTIAKKYGAVFIMQIGDKLKSGQKHDGRSPDYDDWQLNGDIVFWNPVLECAFELSSMGIRVDAESLKNQSEKDGTTERLNFPFHEMILKEELPLTMGGGIGQSRTCMYFLKKAHIGEVQTSIWDAETEKKSKEFNISLL